MLDRLQQITGTTTDFFEADVTYDSSLLDGLKIQYGGAVKVAVRRPDRLHVEFDGDERRSQIVIDGDTMKTYSFLNFVGIEFKDDFVYSKEC